MRLNGSEIEIGDGHRDRRQGDQGGEYGQQDADIDHVGQRRRSCSFDA